MEQLGLGSSMHSISDLANTVENIPSKSDEHIDAKYNYSFNQKTNTND